ncbi:MAG: hypothetical protein ABIO83_05925 [Ilumatobacteraceae bacterium]
MSKRNILWLIVVGAITAIVWITTGWIWGILAGIATLVVSELIERSRRSRRRAARGETGAPRLSEALKSRRSR